MNESRIKNLLNGQTTGIAAFCARAVLSLASVGYGLVISIRNVLLNVGLKSIHHVSVPVISIGNLTTGGTGKTPLVALVCQMLLQAKQFPGIVSRGYRSVDSLANDEKLVLNILCPAVPHEQNPDRVAAAKSLTSGNPSADKSVSVIVMDDGFQHRRLHRDLNIVLIDATNPFGYAHLLPRGLLREPLSSLRRADVVIITRTDHMTEFGLAEIERTVVTAAPKLAGHILHVEFQPTSLRRRDGSTMPLSDVAAMTVHLMAGIGNPEAFQTTVTRAGIRVSGTTWFPDHHHYSQADLDHVRRKAAESKVPSNGVLVVTTLKDLVKLPAESEDVAALEIAAVFPKPQHQEMLRAMITKAACGSR